jgi:hypothetical protein
MHISNTSFVSIPAVLIWYLNRFLQISSWILTASLCVASFEPTGFSCLCPAFYTTRILLFLSGLRFCRVGWWDGSTLTAHPLAEGLLMNLIMKRIIKLPSRPENHGNRKAGAEQSKEKLNGPNLHFADYTRSLNGKAPYLPPCLRVFFVYVALIGDRKKGSLRC